MSNIPDCIDEYNLSAAMEGSLPFAIYKPKMFIDGDQWCALYGDNLQDGIAGFGDSPNDAKNNFNINWFRNLTKINGETK